MISFMGIPPHHQSMFLLGVKLKVSLDITLWDLVLVATKKALCLSLFPCRRPGVCQLWGHSHSPLETGWHGTLPVQCLRALPQDERTEPAAHQAQAEAGKNGHARASHRGAGPRWLPTGQSWWILKRTKQNKKPKAQNTENTPTTKLQIQRHFIT